MTTKSILTVAAVLAAGITLLTPTAEAGGGIRLGCGPLGSFVARPTQGLLPHPPTATAVWFAVLRQAEVRLGSLLCPPGAPEARHGRQPPR